MKHALYEAVAQNKKKRIQIKKIENLLSFLLMLVIKYVKADTFSTKIFDQLSFHQIPSVNKCSILFAHIK